MIEGKRSAEDFAKGALDKTNSHPTRRAEAAMAAGAHPTCGADGRIDEIADPPQPCRPPCRAVPPFHRHGHLHGLTLGPQPRHCANRFLRYGVEMDILLDQDQIGRASCRERVCSYV